MGLNDFYELQKAYNLRGIELHQLHERLSSLEEEIAQLKELLKLQQERLFGKKSEASGYTPASSEDMPGAHHQTMSLLTQVL